MNARMHSNERAVHGDSTRKYTSRTGKCRTGAEGLQASGPDFYDSGNYKGDSCNRQRKIEDERQCIDLIRQIYAVLPCWQRCGKNVPH